MVNELNGHKCLHPLPSLPSLPSPLLPFSPSPLLPLFPSPSLVLSPPLPLSLLLTSPFCSDLGSGTQEVGKALKVCGVDEIADDIIAIGQELAEGKYEIHLSPPSLPLPPPSLSLSPSSLSPSLHSHLLRRILEVLGKTVIGILHSLSCSTHSSLSFSLSISFFLSFSLSICLSLTLIFLI